MQTAIASPKPRKQRRPGFGMLVATMLGGAFGTMLLPNGAYAEGMRAAYQVHVGGLTALDGRAVLSLDRDRYAVEVEAMTGGFVGQLLSWQSLLRSHGTVGRSGLAPSRHEVSSVWRGERRSVTLSYDGGSGVSVTAVPAPEKDGREPVPEALQRNTLDPMSAIVAVVQANGRGQGCTHTLPVYDGRRRYDMIFTDYGMQQLAPSAYSVFSGPARHCRVTYEPIAGYSRKPPSTWFGQNNANPTERRPVDVWFAPVTPDGPPIPVRVETDSPMGTVIAHLTDVSVLQPAAAAPRP